MINAIVKEIKLSPCTEGQGNSELGKAQTLYFGGGTPSILGIDELNPIFETLNKHIGFSDDIEITLEANPDDITTLKLQQWKSMGINRLSIGIQSFLDEELKWMNRVHNSKESLHCIDLVRDASFDNFSVDLIYGSPLLSDDNWKQHVEMVIEKNIPHVSCYALTVEPKTALDKMIAVKKKQPVDPEKQARQFLLLMDWMAMAGYEHYEISNFAKPGMRSKHNSSYWSQTPEGKGKPYYGFGPSAHSFDGISRRWNISNNALYIKILEKGGIVYEEEILTPTQQLNEYIMTSLRTIEGLDLDHVNTKFGEKFSNDLWDNCKKYIAGNKLLTNNSKLILTKEGKLFADGIAADLFM